MNFFLKLIDQSYLLLSTAGLVSGTTYKLGWSIVQGQLA